MFVKSKQKDKSINNNIEMLSINVQDKSYTQFTKIE